MIAIDRRVHITKAPPRAIWLCAERLLGCHRRIAATAHVERVAPLHQMPPGHRNAFIAVPVADTSANVGGNNHCVVEPLLSATQDPSIIRSVNELAEIDHHGLGAMGSVLRIDAEENSLDRSS
jgi:hypothetical protein